MFPVRVRWGLLLAKGKAYGTPMVPRLKISTSARILTSGLNGSVNSTLLHHVSSMRQPRSLVLINKPLNYTISNLQAASINQAAISISFPKLWCPLIHTRTLARGISLFFQHLHQLLISHPVLLLIRFSDTTDRLVQGGD